MTLALDPRPDTSSPPPEANPLLAAALDYASHGLYVLPLLPRRKDPATTHGFKDATLDAATIRQWWQKTPDANIGIATGPSGLLVVDLDVRPGKDGVESWQSLPGDKVETLEAQTGSGGRHLYYRAPSADFRCTASRLGDGIDTRACGGYVVAPPSVHANGREYLWDGLDDFSATKIADAPSWLLALLTSPAAAPAVPEAVRLSPEKVQEIRAALGFVCPDDRDDWLKIGMALRSTGADTQALGLWSEWSKGSEKYDERDQRRTWAGLSVDGGITLSSLFALAHEGGYVEPPVVVEVVDEPVEPTRPDDESILIPPPGFLRDAVDFTLAHAPYPEPVMALAAALPLAGVILGNRYQGPSGLRTNLYTVGIAPTGTGKDHPRKVAKLILSECERADLLGSEDIFSGTGLLAALQKSAASLFQFDEFGKLLQHARDSRGAGLNGASGLLTMLLKTFSSADSILLGPGYADAKARPRVDIPYPCCCLFCTATGDTFYPALTDGDVASGYLPRFLVFSTDRRPPAADPVPATAVPSSIRDWVSQATTPPREHGNLVGVTPATPYTVAHDDSARQTFREFRAMGERHMTEDQEQVSREMWSRANELALRIGTIAAVSANPEYPVVNSDLASWSCRLVDRQVSSLVNAVSAKVSESPYHGLRKSFLRAIVEAGRKGLTARDMGRLSVFAKVEPRLRAAVLSDLVSSELVHHGEVASASGTGRPRAAYIAAKFVKQEATA